eukprot:g2796.t1
MAVSKFEAEAAGSGSFLAGSFRKQFEAGEKEAEVNELMMRYDKNGDGEFSREEVKAIIRDKMLSEHIAKGKHAATKRMAEAYNAAQDRTKRLRRMIACVSAISIVIIGILLALVRGANELSKESHVSDSNVLTRACWQLGSGSGGSCAAGGGGGAQPVATAPLAAYATLIDLVDLPRDALSKLKTLSFTAIAEGGRSSLDVEMQVGTLTVDRDAQDSSRVNAVHVQAAVFGQGVRIYAKTRTADSKHDLDVAVAATREQSLTMLDDASEHGEGGQYPGPAPLARRGQGRRRHLAWSRTSHNDGYAAFVGFSPSSYDDSVGKRNAEIMCAVGCKSWHCRSKTTLELYVDAAGKGGNDGCAPHKATNSLWAVMDKAQKIVARGGKPIIHLRGDLVRSSRLDKSLEIDYRLDGTTFRGSPDGAALRGAKLVEGWAAVPAGDPVFQKLVAGEAALRGKLFVAPLGTSFGHGDLGELTRHGYPDNKFPTKRPPVELLRDGKRLTRSRYPKPQQPPSRLKGVSNRDKDGPPVFKVSDHDRIARWAGSLDTAGGQWGVWLDGIIGKNWEHTFNRIKVHRSSAAGAGGEAEEEITLAGPQEGDIVWKSQYDPTKPISSSNVCCYNFFHFDNVFEEISEAGEYYVDVPNRRVYLMTDGAAPPSRIYATMLQVPAIKFRVRGGRAPSGITIENLLVEGGRDSGIDAAAATHVTLRNLEVRGFGLDGVRLGADSVVDSCDIHAVGRHGVYATAGDYGTLSRGNAIVWNSHVHHYSEWQRVYAAAIRSVGVGHSILHNKIDSSPHVGLLVTGNDHTVAFNDISRTGLVYVDM